MNGDRPAIATFLSLLRLRSGSVYQATKRPTAGNELQLQFNYKK